MKKLNYAWLCYGASAAVLLAVFLLPASGWTLRNHLDLLTGGWKVGDTYPTRSAYPYRLIGPLSPPGVYPEPAWMNGAKYPRRVEIRTLLDYAREHPNDVPAQARILLRGIQVPSTGNLDLPNRNWVGFTARDLRREALAASQQGARLDPDNAFFWTAQAILLKDLGNTSAAYEALAHIRSCTRFDEYANDEADDRYSDFITRVGYRGERPREVYQSSIILPHYQAIKRFAGDLAKSKQDPETVQAEADLLRAADLMERKDPQVIGVLVGASTGAEILRVAKIQPIPPRPPISPAEAKAFNDRQRRLGIEAPFDVREYAARQARIKQAIEDINVGETDPVSVAYARPSTALAPALLVALYLAVMVAAVTAKMRPGTDMPRRLLPFAVALSAVSFAFLHDFQEVKLAQGVWTDYMSMRRVGLDHVYFSYGAFMTLCAALQFSRRLRRHAVIAGGLGSLAMLYYGYPLADSVLPPGLFLILSLCRRIHSKVPSWSAGSLLLIVCIGAGSAATAAVLSNPSETGFAYLLIGCTAVCVALAANGSRRLLAAAPIVTVLLVGAYLGAVVRELRLNQEVKSYLDGWRTEAQLTRAKAGIPD